jgi:hypothetical protein
MQKPFPDFVDPGDSLEVHSWRRDADRVRIIPLRRQDFD